MSLRLRLPDEIHVERLLHRRLVVLPDQPVGRSLMRQHVSGAGIADVVQFHDDLKPGRPLHPDGARNIDGLRIKISGFDDAADFGIAKLEHITAVTPQPAAEKLAHRFGRRWRRLAGAGRRRSRRG